MENREKDRISQRTSSTDAGDVNRRTSAEEGREKSGTGTEFGQNIGRSENLGEEGGSMDNRNQRNKGSDLDKVSSEESRRPSGSYGSSSGRSSSSQGSDISSDINSSDELNENQRSRTNRGGSMGNSGSSSSRH